VGRLGRSEIVVVAPDATREGGEALVERVRAAAVDAPARVGNQLRRVVVSASIVAVPDLAAAASDVVSFVLQAASQLRAGRTLPAPNRAAI
jgi:GGDEF domain-containing protein